MVDLILVYGQHCTLDNQQLGELHKRRKRRGIRRGLVIAALRTNAKDCQESDNDAIVDIAVERVIEQRNTQE